MTDETAKNNHELPIIWEKELGRTEKKPTEWLVKDYITTKSMVILGGKTDTYKTWLALSMAVCIASGRPFLGVHSVKKTKILYIDEENGIEVLKERISMIKKGMDITENLDIAFLSQEGVNIHDNWWTGKIEQFLVEYNIEVVIVDTFRRITKSDEDSATLMNDMLSGAIRGWMKKYRITWILLHHFRKSKEGFCGGGIEELRGSSEFGNYAHSVLISERPRDAADTLIIKHEKMRRVQRQPPQQIQITWENNDTLRLSSLGMEQQVISTPSAVNMCATDILLWAKIDEFKVFNTGDVTEKFGSKYGKETIKRALRSLKNTGKIYSPRRGRYCVVEPNADNPEKFIDPET